MSNEIKSSNEIIKESAGLQGARETAERLKKEVADKKAKEKKQTIIGTENDENKNKEKVGIENVNREDSIDNDTKEKNYDIPNFVPKTREDFLALKYADKWGERENLLQFLKYVYKVGAFAAEPIAANIDEIPQEKIKKSKGALLIWVLVRTPRRKFDKKG